LKISLQTKLFFLLIIAALLSGVWGYNNATIKTVTIFDKDQHVIPYTFSEDEIDTLQTSLETHEYPLPTPPESVVVNFTITFKHALFGHETYELINMTEDDLIVRVDNQYFEVADKTYFYTAEPFEGLYEHFMPVAPLLDYGTSAPEISLISSQWKLKKYDTKWHTASLDTVDSVPTVEITSLEEPVALIFDLMPDSISLSYIDQSTHQIIMVSPTKNEDGYLLQTPEYDFLGHYTLTAYYTDPEKSYQGDLNYRFNLNYDFPMTLEIEKQTIEQGEPLHVVIRYITGDEKPILHQDLTDQKVYTVQNDMTESAWLPTTYHTSPGNYHISLGDATFDITVVPREFNVQHLTIDKKIASDTRNDEAYTEFDAIFDPVRLTSQPEDLTDGDFILPVKGRLSTEYGETRDVNGSPTTYRHSGWDIATPRGSIVKATNRGHVVLANMLMLTGNTIVIDHGNGIFSTYFHLDTLNCSKGDIVEKSSVIGTVGTTGFSTGPHLHFIMSIDDQNLEPGYFIYGKAMTYKNYQTLMNP